MSLEGEQWERLVAFLASWATVEEQGPGRLRVGYTGGDGTARSVEIRMSEEDWSDTVSLLFGSFDAAAVDVRDTILALAPEDHFLLHVDYRLEPSATEERLPDPARVRMDEAARRSPGGFGRWYALNPDGSPGEAYTPDPSS